ncbi:type II toxin-antitoxin system HigB family toxin [Parasediminibacterium sp. JCM 36343]|uniref:type II toxin-antitoxin system HigB family toxin n=1 Tax=Parasediminibacterium sp. JCM 36343 TaxID=3374279 RepID=UPI00397E329A
MVVFSYKTIRNFCIEHPMATDALNNWYLITEQSNWSNFYQVKETFNSVDSVGNDRYVFNIKGNQFRLIAISHFNTRTVYIAFVGTHKEYDKINAQNVLFKK